MKGPDNCGPMLNLVHVTIYVDQTSPLNGPRLTPMEINQKQVFNTNFLVSWTNGNPSIKEI